MANHHGLTYHHDSFVNREAELALIVDKAKRMRDNLPCPPNPPEQQRVVKFNAERGMGKSWLLQEAAWRLQGEDRIVASYLDLGKYVGQLPEHSIRNIVEALGHISSTPSLKDATDRLVLDLDSHPETLVVVLVDHIDEADKDFLDMLDSRCLSLLTTRPNALLVLVERGRGHNWITLALRHASARLQRFAPDHTHEQLQRQVPGAAGFVTEIQQRSNGIPLANLLFGQEIVAGPTNPAPDVIEALLGRAAPYRRRFEALCVLRAFDELRMQVMFTEYLNALGDLAWDIEACVVARKELVSTDLVHWNGDKRGYVIDAALRPILENALRAKEEAQWRRLHLRAYRLYTEWAERYSRSREEWVAEAAYHADVLQQSVEN